ncbi:MAG: alpha/beta hydrolase fold domain-containing protein [Acetobacteraceae bacterium]|nr:alpha/beta hydrolase fold domain-containing protein [Acetobacteraceae bacterium]
MAETLQATEGDMRIEDIPYRRRPDGGEPLLARLYRPARGTGPFPAVVEVHGGAWTGSDRLNNAAIATEFAREGIVTLSLDFRMPPEAPYPASLADIN